MQQPHTPHLLDVLPLFDQWLDTAHLTGTYHHLREVQTTRAACAHGHISIDAVP
jgi:hypothetical protein